MHDPRLALFLRFGAGLLVLAALLLWLGITGRARAARLFGPAAGEVGLLAAITWGAAIVTLSAMVLGALGLLTPLAWLALAGLGGFALRGLRVASRAFAPPGPAGSVPAISWPFALGTGAIVLGRVLFGLRNAPVEVDTVQYHLPMAAHWMATHGLGAVAFEPRQLGIFFPGNVELFSLALAWTAGRETLMTVPGVLGLGLLALGVRALALEAGAKRPVAEALALALACAPGVVQLTLGLRVENVSAGWLAVALVFALRARRTGGAGDHEVALAALGMFGGCKSTAPVLAAVVLALVIAGVQPGMRLRRMFANPFALLLLVVPAGFWLARNGIAAGNPLYPAAFTIGPWKLPGLQSEAFLERTSQWAMWRAGLPGHLTPLNFWRYFGPIGAALLPGMLAALVLAIASWKSSPRRGTIAILLVVGLVATAMTLTQPFSGANAPPVPGVPMRYSSDNVRYAMSSAVVLVPLAALGLSQLPALPVTLVCVALMVPGLIPRAGHVLPALALCVLIALALRLRPRSRALAIAWRTALVVACCGMLAAAMTLAEPLRGRIAESVWEANLEGKDGIPAGLVRQVCEESAGRPIAVSGVSWIWDLYGRDLRGRPEYVPVSHPLAVSRSRWSFAPDPRSVADSALWLRNVNDSGARYLMVRADTRLVPLERDWASRDTAHFACVFASEKAAVYRVLEDAGAARGAVRRTRTKPLACGASPEPTARSVPARFAAGRAARCRAR